MEKNFCFHARVGSDRYRLALLTLYPQLAQLREIVKRLAVVHSAAKRPETSDGNATVIADVKEEQTDAIKTLRRVEENFENVWTIVLESAGVLSNAFAPYPTENCNGPISKNYASLWSRSDTLFFQSLDILKRCFIASLDQLRTVAAEEPLEKVESNIQQQPIDIRQLYKETRQLESFDTRLKQTSINSITMETSEGQTIELQFPVSSSRLLL